MVLPPIMASAAAAGDGAGQPQLTAPFGDGVLQCLDTTLAAETCEELFTPQAPHIGLALAGVEIISNGSGSHHQLRKLDTRLDLIKGATAKAGGVYLYANQRGCDGGRLYFDGCASVAVNGEFVAQGAQFGLEDVEVITACVDLDEVVSFRGSVASLREQASTAQSPNFIPVDFRLCKPQSCFGASASTAHSPSPEPSTLSPSLAITPRIHRPEEEIAYGPACWLWDYLRRSGGAGYLSPLSGGADSASTAAIVGAMCQMVKAAVDKGDQQVMQDARRIGQYSPEEPIASTSQEFASRVFVTVYMGTVNSSQETRDRAAQLAREIGAYHINFGIDTVVEALVSLFATIMGKRPAFRAHGGSNAENLALQNIQARLRMVIAFLLAQLVPWVRDRKGFLLVLGSANVDECLRGYLTKYDCSSADVNPIGGISKQDLRRFLRWGASALGYPALQSVVEAVPTAELEPLTKGATSQVCVWGGGGLGGRWGRGGLNVSVCIILYVSAKILYFLVEGQVLTGGDCCQGQTLFHVLCH
ncbi:glutamine-dependent NAD(+) synthetase [Dunaliella salina]|uniref:Glutamine-dependent NAD(+) synthetase n=1 Tax=Dunaliella salina TaxID=3046 RepID=A0ABQ7HA51_DUNSA|nr:glutamine-dependent NAD(+) synthetase [Dunaliella salina]|eukprot:KAF5843733.1 glutamine-dependent NAD(+) synthetase [Dunaliella salina]